MYFFHFSMKLEKLDSPAPSYESLKHLKDPLENLKKEPPDLRSAFVLHWTDDTSCLALNRIKQAYS